MPAPSIVTLDQIPIRKGPGRPTPAYLKILVDQIKEYEDTLVSLRSGDAMMFQLNSHDDPSFIFTAATKHRVKDRYRRLFRNSMKRIFGNDAAEMFSITYSVDVNPRPDGSWEANGFTAWVYRVREDD